MRAFIPLAICCFSFVCCAEIAKGFYCRDPDTGKLHDVNTTWPSTTFCGNYTCKIKKINRTEPLRQMNISKLEETPSGNAIMPNNSRSDSYIAIENKINIQFDPDSKKFQVNSDDVSGGTDVLSQSSGEIGKIRESSEGRQTAKEHNHKTENEMMKEKITSVMLDKIKTFDSEINKNDRYLTDDEIKTLGGILRTVKKSDLEAIMEVYNLAQEIYKEIETVSAEDIHSNETKNSVDKIDVTPAESKKKVSYWYEPLDAVKMAAMEDGKLKLEIDPADTMAVGESKVQTTISPTFTTPKLIRSTEASRDIHKVLPPTYYPISSFQRISTYVHPLPIFPATSTLQPITKTKCTQLPNAIEAAQRTESWVNYVDRANENARIVPLLMPYPFVYADELIPGSVTPEKSIQTARPLVFLNFDKQPPIVLPENSYVNTYPQAVFINSDLSSDVREVEQTQVFNKNYIDNNINPPKETIDNNPEPMPDWQTAPLSTNVLNEVKANVISKSKLLPFPLRKKVKFEKVAKLIKLEDLRVKRDLNSLTEETQYEVFLERTTCRHDIEPGFFRMGNESEPYPSCCPQRIPNSS